MLGCCDWKRQEQKDNKNRRLKAFIHSLKLATHTDNQPTNNNEADLILSHISLILIKPSWKRVVIDVGESDLGSLWQEAAEPVPHDSCQIKVRIRQ